MPGMLEISESEARNKKGWLVELKVDGTRMTYHKGVLTSDRNINRNARYGHILEQVKQIDWKVRGEIAIPGSNIGQLNKKENWHKAHYFIFDLYELRGKPIVGLDVFQIRALIEKELKRANLSHLHAPKLFKSFAEGWAHVKKHDAEGVVLKESDGTCWKCKLLKEEKLEIISHVSGKAKGAFMIDRNGVQSRVSGTSIDFVNAYKALSKAGKKVYAEIEYAFITDKGIPFQPRLRRIGTLQDLKFT